MSPRSSADTDARVLNYLEREADMDGYVTTLQREIAVATGRSNQTVIASLQRLEAAGAVKRIMRGRGHSGPGGGRFVTTSEFQLLGEEWS